MIFGENNAQIINSAALFLEHCNFPSILTLPTIPRESQCKCWEVFFRKHNGVFRQLCTENYLKAHLLKNTSYQFPGSMSGALNVTLSHFTPQFHEECTSLPYWYQHTTIYRGQVKCPKLYSLPKCGALGSDSKA